MHEESRAGRARTLVLPAPRAGRIEILEAEQARRERGGSVEDLVADLPRILQRGVGRSSITNTRRRTAADPPSIELHWPDGREQLVVDNTLAKLPGLPLDELASTLESLRAVRARGLRPPLADARRDGRDRPRDRRPPRRRDRGMKTESLDSLETRLHDLGGFIRDQRRNARLSLRKLSELAGISNPYLSQIERGLRKPSAEILQGIAAGCGSRPRRSTCGPASSTSRASPPTSLPRSRATRRSASARSRCCSRSTGRSSRATGPRRSAAGPTRPLHCAVRTTGGFRGLG